MLEKLLSQCGFNSNEQLVLAYLLEHGGSSAGAIAKRTALKRPTVYAVLDSLVEAGIITRNKREKVVRFTSIPPESFAEMLELRAKNKYEQVAEASSKLAELLKDVGFRGARDLAGFGVETFESSESVLKQLHESLLSGDLAAIFDPQLTLVGKSKEIALEFLRQTAKTKPKIREIAVDGPLCRWYMARIKNENHRVVPIPASKKIMNDVILFKGTVMLMNYTNRRESAIRIRQPEFYQTMMTIFEMMWGSAN